MGSVRRLGLLISCVCSIIVLSSCSSSGNSAPTLQSISVTAVNLSIAKGLTTQFKATAMMSNGTTEDVTGSVTWTSLNTGVATITASGLAKAVAVGSATIQATSAATNSSVTLQVTAATLTSIAVTSAIASIAKGTTDQFTATGTFTDGTTQNLTASVTWTALNTGVATIGPGGLATGVGAGSTTIQAASGGVSSTEPLSVTPATLVSITVTAANPSIPDGSTDQFTATGTFSDATTQNITGTVTWSSLNPGFATITAGGLAKGVGIGSARIQAASGNISNTAILQVSASVLVSIAVTAASPSIVRGTTDQFTATGTFTDNSTQNLTGSVSWTSLSTSVATIAAGGLATGVGVGTAIIQASQESITGTTSLTVSAATLVSIAVTPTNPTVAPGLTVQFTATGTFADTSTQNLTNSVTWSSSSTAVATISNTAGSNGLATAVSNGSTTIQAQLGTVTGSTTLTVNAVSVAVLVVGPQNHVIGDGGATEAFTATGHFADGSTQDLTASATWTSSNTSVATMSGAVATSQTLAGGMTAGFTSIQAVVGGKTGVAILSVAKQGGNGFAGVFTQHNDIARTGLNANETTLTPASVRASFGKKFSAPVDAAIYAQPLYVPNVSIGGGTHNVVYVVTEGDSAYAFDADTGTPYWHANMIDPAHGGTGGETTVSAATDVSCDALAPIIGITSTPVIDPSTGIMYVETNSKKTNGTIVHRLHGIDITTGLEKLGTPPDITGTAGGGSITFNALTQMNRPGLLWLNGMIYVAYASNCDNTPYYGWIFAYDAATLTQKSLWNSTPNSNVTGGGGLGGIWMSGAGLAADSAGNIFLATGNGIFDTVNVPATQLGDSDVKLFYNGTTTFSLVDYFTPFNQLNLSNADFDLGAGGVLLLPDQPGTHPHELVQAGKEGTIRLIDRDQMTTGNLHYCASNCNTQDAQIAQELVSAVGMVFSTPAYWNGNVYICGTGDSLASYVLNGSGMLSTTQSHSSTHVFKFPGATPSVSANGTTNAIVWAIDTSNNGTSNGGTSTPLLPAVLHAFDATNLSELYDSSVVAGDAAGDAVKFTVPTVANGKVYIGTATELDVYGPLP